jgi:hypothetical protein
MSRLTTEKRTATIPPMPGSRQNSNGRMSKRCQALPCGLSCSVNVIRTSDLGIGCKAYHPTTQKELNEATVRMQECPNMAFNTCRCCISPYVEEGSFPMPENPIVQWAFTRKQSWISRLLFKSLLRRLLPQS